MRGCERSAVRPAVVALATSSLCELVWVLGRGYRLVSARGVTCDGEAVQAGLALLDAGGDFAAAVIAHEGARLSGAEFVSFDRRAVRLPQAQGHAARLLA